MSIDPQEFLSERVKGIAESPTLSASRRANELAQEGKSIINLTAGQPHLPPPLHLREACAENAMREDRWKYTAVVGLPELREAVVQKLAREQDISSTIDDIVITTGGKHALAGLFEATLNPGDEVIIPVPYWTSYPEQVQRCGGKAVYVETKAENGFVVDGEMLRSAITPRTKFFLLNSPSNPTGAVYSREDLSVIADIVRENPHVMILSDEIYDYIVYPPAERVAIAQVAPDLVKAGRIVIVNGWSKSYAVTGARLGFLYGPTWLAKAVVRNQSHVTSNVASIMQHAALAAYKDQLEFPKLLVEELQPNIDVIYDWTKRVEGFDLPRKPQGAFYAFIQVDKFFGKAHGSRHIDSAASFANYLLEDVGVAVVQGEAFGDPKSIRISYALSREDLEEGLARMEKAAASLS